MDGGLGGTVDGAAGVRLSASDGANVHDVALTAVGSSQEDGQNGLGHVDEAGDVGAEHNVHVFLSNFGCTGDTFNEAAVKPRVPTKGRTSVI